MKDSTFIRLQEWAPHHALSRFAGFMAFCKISWLKNRLIRNFIKDYDVDLEEAQIQDPRAFIHFNDFFTRTLRDGARPISEGIVSPCDGLMSQWGSISEKTLIQAKGKTYSLEALLANASLAETFDRGLFSTIYLSPKDYHRVHMPLTGTLCQMTYVPGKLYSVNTVTANHIPNLFARNERLVCVFETPEGKSFVVILVGAMIVGSMATTWAGTIKPHQPTLRTWTYPKTSEKCITLQKGDEMGFFHLGSTVILLLSEGIADNWHLPAQATGHPVRMGTGIA